MTFTKQEVEKIQEKYETVEFDIDKKNLLNDVISKQTGDFNKALKELFQNSFDAKADHIDVEITTKGARFIDNGVGMDLNDIRKYFTIFGATKKRGDSSKTGVFGMGRGQIFNFGRILWRTQAWAMIIDIRKSLSYKLLDSNNFVDGTDIIISFYKPLRSWDISSLVYNVKCDVLPPKGVTISIDRTYYLPDVREFKNFTNNDYFVFTSPQHTSKIYNGNLAVTYIKNTNYKYCIMPYEKLELNFARNELIENAESTNKLMDFIYDIEEKMTIEKSRFDIDEAKNILRMLSNKRFKLRSVYDKNIIPLANGKLVSLRELIEKPSMGVLFGGKNIWSDDCLRNDYKVISKNIKSLFGRIISVYGLKIDLMDKNVKELSRKGYHKELELSELTRNKMYFYVALELNDYIFRQLIADQENDLREICLGFSDLSTAWTKPWDDKIWINKSVIQNFQSKEEAIIKLWEILCHEYAHNTSNIEDDYHNHSFYEQYNTNIATTTKLLALSLKFITRKYIKEKYQY